MRNKKIALLMISLVTCVAVGAISIGLTSQIKNEYLDAESFANVVTIDANNPDRKMDKGSGEISYTSALGNEFYFYYSGVALNEGKYLVDGTLRNITPLNGIYKVTINATKAQKIHVSYGQESTYENDDDFELKEGANDIDFESSAPVLLSFYPGSTFEFYSISIYYSCVAPKKEKQIKRFEVNHLSTFNIYNEKDLFAVEGSTLNEISLDKMWVQTTDDRIFYIDDMSEVSDLSITYNDELLASSTVVVKGTNSVSISFYLNGWRFYSNDTKLIGYESINETITSLDLQETSFLIQINDDMPKNFKLSVRYTLDLIDSDEKTVRTVNGYVNDITITSDMILKIDEHPFSERGEHSVKIQYQGKTVTIEYTVYDPDYCNIRSIYYPGSTLKIPAGSTKAEFLELIKDLDFNISYYNYDESLPQTTKLTESNFPTLDDNTFNGGMSYVEVDIVYDTYEGTIFFSIGQTKGNLIKTYTNDKGILVVGMTVVAIKIYDNGVAELIAKDSTEGELFQYTLEGTTLSISFQGVLLKYTVDDTNNTFDKYQSTAQLIRSFKVDFSALGAPELFDANQYDDGTIEFIIMGSSMSCNYTEDPSNDHIVYFSFNGQACVGTFNDDYSVLVVSFAS